MKCVEQIKTPAANRNADGEDSSVLAFSSCDVTETSSRKKQGLFGLTASEVWVTVGYPAVSHQDITVHHGGHRMEETASLWCWKTRKQEEDKPHNIHPGHIPLT